MDLTNTFNSRDFQFSRQNDNVLLVKYSIEGYKNTFIYDFMSRLLITRMEGYPQYQNLTPFAQLDREVLAAMRDKLAELGGKPPELAPEAATGPAPKRGLNP